MARDMKAILAAKLAENQAKHNHAHQDTGFDAGRTHTRVSVELIDPNPYQPRTDFPVAELEALAQSIHENGLMQPILLRQAEGRYQIIAGERRWRAHKILQRSHIEAIVSDATDAEMAVFALVENIDREDLSDYEISKAVVRMDELFRTRTDLAKALGKDRADTYRYFAFGTLPSFVRDLLETSPRLLSRSAADSIKKVMVKHNDSQDALSALRTAMDLVVAKELDQTKVADYIERVLRGEPRSASAADALERGGVKVGSISKDARNITIKLKTQELSAGQEKKLREFVAKLIAEKV